VLGFLHPGSPAPDPIRLAFFRALGDLGRVEGETLGVEYRWGEEREERLPDLAAELVRLPVDVIFAPTALAAHAAKSATGTIPIVCVSNDPVRAGLVASLARPGGNVTGLSLTNSTLSAKRLELLKQALPGIARVGILAYAAGTTVKHDWTDTLEAGRALGLELWRHDVQAPADLEGGFAAVAAWGAEALLVLPEAFVSRHRGLLVDLAARYRLPAIYESRLFAEAGGLMSYGANVADVYRRAVAYVDKILKGARPSDLPVEQPSTFDFVINLGTARALGLAIPQAVLQQATELIQ
jgi:putative ABC transport system substrate-binding protein